MRTASNSEKLQNDEISKTTKWRHKLRTEDHVRYRAYLDKQKIFNKRARLSATDEQKQKEREQARIRQKNFRMRHKKRERKDDNYS